MVLNRTQSDEIVIGFLDRSDVVPSEDFRDEGVVRVGTRLHPEIGDVPRNEQQVILRFRGYGTTELGFAPLVECVEFDAGS